MNLVAGLRRNTSQDRANNAIVDSDTNGSRPSGLEKDLLEPEPGLWRSCVPGVDSHWTILIGLQYVYTIFRLIA